MTPEPTRLNPIGSAGRVRNRWIVETVETAKAATPVVLAELGWMGMGIVDTIMVGKLGPAAIAGVSLGNVLFFTVGLVGLGLLLGLDTLVSQSFGAGDLRDCRRSLVQGVYLSIGLTPILMVVVALLTPMLAVWGVQAEVVAVAIPYTKTLNWGMLPLLLYVAARRYLQGMNLARSVTAALVSANAVNWLGNLLLIDGRFGFPALGTVGSGIATFIGRIWMAGVLAVAIAAHARREGTDWIQTPMAIDRPRLRRLLAIGAPTAIQIALEVGVFLAAAILAGRLGTRALAAHEVVLNVISVAFTVPLGISSAAAARVGQAIGRRDPQAAAWAGWSAILLGAGFMIAFVLAFSLAPRTILRTYTADRGVVAAGVSLLFVAAIFQMFDGTQVIASGALRGAGETKASMYCNLVAHWGLGLPVGYLLAFEAGWGLIGLWVGLMVGLVVAGIALLVAWRVSVRRLKQALPTRE